jgi:hypothetical protein
MEIGDKRKIMIAIEDCIMYNNGTRFAITAATFAAIGGSYE